MQPPNDDMPAGARPSAVLPRYLRTRQAADYCGLSPRTLEQYRTTGGGPVFCKVGRSVLYQVTDLDTWLQRNRATNTATARMQASGQILGFARETGR